MLYMQLFPMIHLSFFPPFNIDKGHYVTTRIEMKIKLTIAGHLISDADVPRQDRLH